MKFLIITFFTIFSLNTFAQFPSDCDIFKITKKNELVDVVFISHTKKEIFPARKIKNQNIIFLKITNLIRMTSQM